MNIYHVENADGYVLETCASQSVAEAVALSYAKQYYGFRKETITLTPFAYQNDGVGRAYVLCDTKRRHETEHFIVRQDKLIYHEDELDV